MLGSEEIVLEKYLTRLKYSQLIQIHKEDNEKQQNMHLTVETLFDMR